MNRITGTASAIALAACLGACGTKASEDASMNAMANAQNILENAAEETGNFEASAVVTGQDFANTAAASDMFEIESSKIAAKVTTSAAVKKFAQSMIEAHTSSTAKLKTAAGEASPAIKPNPTLPADLQAKLDALKDQKGAEFDAAYIREQTAAHEATLSALQLYAASGDVPSLKAFAAGLVPIVTGHLEMARELKP